LRHQSARRLTPTPCRPAAAAGAARQEAEGWGAKVIDRLSADLREAFPDMHGLSSRNLLFMRAFAAAIQNPK